MQTDITVHNPDQKQGIAMNNNPTSGSSHTSKVLGLTGTTKDASIAVEASAKIAPLPADLPQRDIDLRRMAQWAMNYLIRTPRKEKP